MFAQKHLYNLLWLLCLLGAVWLYYVANQASHLNTSFTPCIIKNITSLPCPSCGVSRAIVLVFEGNIMAAIKTNPLVIVVVPLIICMPVLLLFDAFTGKKILLNLYNKTAFLSTKPSFSILFGLIIGAVWFYNIYNVI